MDGWTIFFLIALAAALFTTVFVLIKKKREKEDMLPETKSSSPEKRGTDTEAKAVKNEETLPANVAVLYEGLRSGAAKRCRSCGCEYALSVTICEICGEKL